MATRELTMQKEEVLFKTHYNGLCHFAWKILGDLTIAEDLVQDSFIAYFKNTDQVSDNEIAIKKLPIQFSKICLL